MFWRVASFNQVNIPHIVSDILLRAYQLMLPTAFLLLLLTAVLLMLMLWT